MLCLTLATRNAHKTREFAEILGPEFFVGDLSSIPDFPMVQEIGRTFEENACLKAHAASERVTGLVVADDSGLEVDALEGRPGIYSARFAGEDATDRDNVAKLLSELAVIGCANEAPRARFRCAVALARDGEILSRFEGAAEGVIDTAPRGRTGFGYDPVFVPDGFSETFAQLGSAIKNRRSHRAAAIAQLRHYLLERDVNLRQP